MHVFFPPRLGISCFFSPPLYVPLLTLPVTFFPPQVRLSFPSPSPTLHSQYFPLLYVTLVSPASYFPCPQPPVFLSHIFLSFIQFSLIVFHYSLLFSSSNVNSLCLSFLYSLLFLFFPFWNIRMGFVDLFSELRESEGQWKCQLELSD